MGQPKACLFGGGDEHIAERVVVAQILDFQRPTGAVEFGGPALLILGFDEKGQNAVEIPAGAVPGRPIVVIFTMAPAVAHGIDRTGPAQDLAAGPIQFPVVQLGFRLRMVIPVDTVQRDQLGKARWHVYERVPVRAAGFQQEHALGRVFAQASRHDAARGAATHNDIVVFHSGSAQLE